VVTYAEEVIRDERLRADIRAAAGHGAKASERVKRDVDAGGITSRLADDKKLRRNLRAMLDDLDSASDRMRGKKSHRVRNVLLGIAAALAAIAVIPRIRLWVSERNGTRAGSSQAAPNVTARGWPAARRPERDRRTTGFALNLEGAMPCR
jgi:hypothetical protein